MSRRSLGLGFLLVACALGPSGAACVVPPPVEPPVGSRPCCSLWGPADVPTVPAHDEGLPVEVGVRLRVRADGRINAVRYYRAAHDVEARRATLWTASGDAAAEVTFPARDTSGWQVAPLDPPVAAAADSEWVVSVFSESGKVVLTPGYFTERGHAYGPLEAPRDTDEKPNGVRRTGSAGFPTEPAAGANHWVDVGFLPADVDPPHLTVTGPAEDESVRGTVEVTGTVVDEESGPFKVEVSVAGAAPVLAEGTTDFVYRWDTTRVPDGPLTLEVTATDRAGNVSAVRRSVRVHNGGSAAWSVEPLALDRAELRAHQTVTATVVVRNVGEGAGQVGAVSLTARATGGNESRPFEVSDVAGVIPPGESMRVTGTLRLTAFDPLGDWAVAGTITLDGQPHAVGEAVVALRHVVPLGAAVSHGRLLGTEAAYAQTFRAHFDSLTPEVGMKIAQLQPQQGVFDFAAADELVDYAERHGKQVRGHVLVWHKSLPAWLTERSWTREELIGVMRHHIATVVGRYKGRIAEWDVVNEAFEDSGVLRQSLWHQVIGPDFIALAFEAAHAADPEARLFYNDYNAERINTKFGAIYNLMAQLRAQGVPVHGVGMQTHQSTTYNSLQSSIEPVIVQFAQLGLESQITEMDVKVAAASHLDTAQKLALQVQIYGAVAQACQAQPSCTRLTTWGITDKYSWLGASEMPLLFDVNYAPKPAFHEVARVLGRTP